MPLDAVKLTATVLSLESANVMKAGRGHNATTARSTPAVFMGHVASHTPVNVRAVGEDICATLTSTFVPTIGPAIMGQHASTLGRIIPVPVLLGSLGGIAKQGSWTSVKSFPAGMGAVVRLAPTKITPVAAHQGSTDLTASLPLTLISALWTIPARMGQPACQTEVVTPAHVHQALRAAIVRK